MNKDSILIVDDEKGLRELLTSVFKEEGYEVFSAGTGNRALELLEKKRIDVVILDHRLPDTEGLEVLRRIVSRGINTQVIFLTAYGTDDVALEALRLGAYNYVEKPFKIEGMKLFVEKAVERNKLILEINYFKEKEDEGVFFYHGIVGKSEKLSSIVNTIEKIKNSRSTVLITGESGTGKEMVARAIHEAGERKRGRFIAVNCGAIPENLMESELFGHKKGAFTGAVTESEGLFKAAHRGTILLDEITEVPRHLQVKLLRAIETKMVRPVGSSRDYEVDVRVICASNKNVEEEVKKGNFRQDLYYRINVIRINIPPLRERREDIPVLADYFLMKYAKEFGSPVKRFSHSAIDILMTYNFPGNVRELDNIVERAVAISKLDVILPEDLPGELLKRVSSNFPADNTDELPDEGIDLKKVISDIEKKYLLLALEKAKWNKTKAAKYLKMEPRPFRYLFEKHKIGEKKENK